MGKLSKALLSVAIILHSLGVGVIQANPSSFRSLVPGPILIAVSIIVAVIWEEEFKSEIFLEVEK